MQKFWLVGIVGLAGLLSTTTEIQAGKLFGRRGGCGQTCSGGSCGQSYNSSGHGGCSQNLYMANFTTQPSCASGSCGISSYPTANSYPMIYQNGFYQNQNFAGFIPGQITSFQPIQQPVQQSNIQQPNISSSNYQEPQKVQPGSVWIADQNGILRPAPADFNKNK